MADTDEFLEHFGVKGMKWGKTTSSDDSSSKAPKAPREKMSKEKKVAIAVGIGSVVAIGAAIALKSMNSNMDIPVSTIASSPAATAGRDLLKLSFGEAAKPAASAGLNLARSAASSAPSGLGASGPSLSALSGIINSTPKIVFDAATGSYVTR